MKTKYFYLNSNENTQVNIPFQENETVLESLKKNKININSSCGGNGTCGTCRIQILAGELPDRNEIESEMAHDRGFLKNERLSCQIEPTESLVIKVLFK